MYHLLQDRYYYLNMYQSYFLLYHMMSHFIYNNLNMTKIESRPIEDRNWEYRFFIDFEGNLSDSAVRNALRGLREEAKMLMSKESFDGIFRN